MKDPVVDSWLVLDGAVRALGRHRARFEAACAAVGVRVPGGGWSGFWTRVAAATPRTGAWFPQVRAVPGGEPEFVLRPAPARMPDVAVWVPGDAAQDRRIAPRLKGPDLDDLMALRHRAREVGADEALLVSPDGWVVEAANSSLMWWEDDVFCIPARVLPALDGVTVGLILEEAVRRGIEVRERLARPEDLRPHEVWLTSALQGIRPVSRWVGPDGSEVPAASAPRAAEWVAWLRNVT
ncbi:MAG: aminotransferase class IV [Galactobacter sp.]|uniref:aminotransferase class IV n=1 Tax=Galactobacter sp. TaxID=2676125 RepID=UPI0025C2DEAA|nr:aminotransferase class IV [Galactobacter sp.]